VAEAVIALDRKAGRRARRFQTAQHLLVALIMLQAGALEFRRASAHLAIAAAEILAATVMFAAVLLAGRRKRLGLHGRVGWVELAAGLLLFVEGFVNHRQPWGVHPQYLSGAVLFALGLFDTRFERWRSSHRYLRSDDEGLTGSLGPFRRVRIPWSDVAGVEESPEAVSIRTSGGRTTRFRFSRFVNGEEIAAWLTRELAHRSPGSAQGPPGPTPQG
jgi:hypothetical protein